MKPKLSFFLFCLLTLSAVEARADDFVITQTSGILSVHTSEPPDPPIFLIPPGYSLSGPGLSVIRDSFGGGGGGDVGSVQARDLCLLTVCQPGTVIATNSTFSGLIGPASRTSAVVNGVSFNMVNVTGELNFTSPPIVIPVSGLVTVPFTFTGTLTGEALQPGVVNPVFTATMSGQGLATFRFEDINRDPSNPRFLLSSVDYRFQPIPEPATLLLLGTGLAGVCAAARRRHKAGRGAQR